MEEQYLYKQIAESIRRDIIQGKLKPGERLPSVREMTKEWNCTPGTVQRAYRELAQQDLVISRPGQGTRISQEPPHNKANPMQRAQLIHRAESFLLEVLTLGYSPSEVEQSFRIALDRWKAVKETPIQKPENVIRFSGSHDLAVDWLAENFDMIAPGYSLQLKFSGSLNGLIALTDGAADIAGSHLWDEEDQSYNTAYIQRIRPGKRTAMVTLAHRRLGLVLPPGNPMGIHALQDLTKTGVKFTNRQSGSGTRVWLDNELSKVGIESSQINGYIEEVSTHSEIARRVAEGQSNSGIGLAATAIAFGLDFIELKKERYDLIIPEESYILSPIKALISWLKRPETLNAINALGGYDTTDTGKITWVD